MSAAAKSILTQLQLVEHERARRTATPWLQTQVTAVKAFQQRRFAHTYADLLLNPRWAAAVQFFLAELYGPSDFSHRDAQFARVVAAMVRLFPTDLVDTVAGLTQLHALSEGLDSTLAEALGERPLTTISYIKAWQTAGRAADREQQITLTLDMAARLDKLTRKPLLSHTLRLMRVPARTAGLADLQHFLETGFDTFRAMNGSHEFMATVDKREHAVVHLLFEADCYAPSDDPQLRQTLAALHPGDTP
jgi:hypothetical protein